MNERGESTEQRGLKNETCISFTLTSTYSVSFVHSFVKSLFSCSHIVLEMSITKQYVPPPAHVPLFQTTAPPADKPWWFCPQHLPWICLQVKPLETEEEEKSLWVWFQVRTAALNTMLHESTIKALGNPKQIHILDHAVDVHDINQGNKLHPHPAGISWHLDHNMLGWDAFNSLSINGTSSVDVKYVPEITPAQIPRVRLHLRKSIKHLELYDEDESTKVK